MIQVFSWNFLVKQMKSNCGFLVIHSILKTETTPIYNEFKIARTKLRSVKLPEVYFFWKSFSITVLMNGTTDASAIELLLLSLLDPSTRLHLVFHQLTDRLQKKNY